MNNNSPAFPRPGTHVWDDNPGLTKREWFAAMALIGLSMAPDRGSVEVVAAESFRMAEAMIAEAEKRAK